MCLKSVWESGVGYKFPLTLPSDILGKMLETLSMVTKVASGSVYRIKKERERVRECVQAKLCR